MKILHLSIITAAGIMATVTFAILMIGSNQTSSVPPRPIGGGIPTIMPERHYPEIFVTQITASKNHVFLLTYEANRTNASGILRVSDDSGLSFGKKIDLSQYRLFFPKDTFARDNTLYIAWDTGHTANDRTISQMNIIKSTDDGNTFEKPIILNWEPYSRGTMSIVIDGKNIYHLGLGKEIGQATYAGLMFRKSTDDGQTFSTVQNLTGSIYAITGTAMAVSGDNVYILFTKFEDNKANLYFTKSIDKGTTFNKAVRLSNENGSAWDMQLIPFGNNDIYVKWKNDDDSHGVQLKLRKSVNAGDSFGPTVDVSPLVAGENTQLSTMGITSKNDLYAVWDKSSNNPPFHKQILFTTSSDGGNSFEAPKDLNSFVPKINIVNPQIAASGNNIYLVGTNSTGNGLVLRISNDGGKTFGPINYIK